MTTAALGLKKSARLFHALSDETRLRILERLRHGERCVCNLTDALDAAQPRLSFHLKILKQAGLVTGRREGRWSYYQLTPEARSHVTGALEVLAPHACGANPSAACCR